MDYYSQIPLYPEWIKECKKNTCQYETRIKEDYYIIIVRLNTITEIMSKIDKQAYEELHTHTVSLERRFYPDMSQGYPIYKAIDVHDYKVPIALEMIYNQSEIDECVERLKTAALSHYIEERL